MRKSYFKTLLAVGVALASLSSCSRANYSFNNSAPAYLGTTHARPVAAAQPATETEASVATAAAPLAAQEVAVVAARPAATHHTAARVSHQSARSAAAETSTARPAFAKADRKEMKQALRQLIKQKKTESTSRVAAGGKSQLVAAILCFFLGGIGVHDFYLGYIGKGILQIFLTLLFGLGIILVIIDFIRILTGSLKPKDGEYEKTL